MITVDSPPQSVSPVSSDKPVLLIVDDDPGPRESLRIVFKERYECLLANNGQAGIELARQRPVDVAILDIRMPDLTGIEVLRELKKIDPGIECIMLTGYETVDTARAAVHYGASEYLNKPFDVFAIREVVAKCLARRKQKRQLETSLQTLQQQNEKLANTLAASARADLSDILSVSIVHELNNPLSIIAGYVQLLERDLHKLTSGDVNVTQPMQQRIGAIQREIQRCKEMSERFLRFSRAPRDPMEIVNVASAIEDVAFLLRAHPAGKGVQIQGHSLGLECHLQASSVEIMQILMNLGINALQAMNGTGRLDFVAERIPQPPVVCTHCSPGYQPQGPHVRISVTDTGCGIAAEDIHQVFHPHYTTKPQGNGLGLAVVVELVNKYRGAIEVISDVGRGTTFHVYLPLAA